MDDGQYADLGAILLQEGERLGEPTMAI